jgi:SAM-dependent methyltransferase
MSSSVDGKFMSWTGLAATVWDPSGGDEPQRDHPYIQALIEKNGGAALDVGCGTGRLLLRYLAAGLAVEGLDSSADMLALCREKAGAQGLKPTLYHQSMHTMDLPRKYRTIFVPCGTFVLLIDRDEAWEALRRMRDHLEPGGTLLLTTFWPFGKGEPLSEKPLGAMGDWGKLWDDTLDDGSVIAQHIKIEQIDRVEQLLLAKRRYQLIREGQIVGEEIFASNERWYYKHEMELMLRLLGMTDIRITGDWTGEPFRDGHDTMVIEARR